MGGLSRWAVRRPWWALGAFLLMAVVIGVMGTAFKGTLNDSFSLPDTESKTATDLLAKTPYGGFDKVAATVIWSPQSGTAADATSAGQISPLLKEISTLPGVACVTLPFSRTEPSAGPGCEKQQAPTPPAGQTPAQADDYTKALQAAAAAGSPVSPDGKVAMSTITFTAKAPGDVPTATSKAIIELVKSANGQNGMQVGANGEVLSFAGQEPPKSEGIGITVALIILLVAFGSLVAAGLPLLTAGFGVALGGLLLLYVARFADVATFAPTLASMIGLGVGIDYSLCTRATTPGPRRWRPSTPRAARSCSPPRPW
jgi:RND superfamily putative drug exporter